MIKILRGDDSEHSVDIDLPEAAFAPGFRLEFIIGGLTQTFPAARRVSLAFPATWTALQAPGRILGRWSIISPTGQRATLSSTYPVYVTTDASAVGAAGAVTAVIPSVDLSDLKALDSAATPGDTKELVNEILRRLRSSCIALAAAILPLVSAAAEVKTAMLDDIPGTANVVTNVDLSGLVTAADLDAKRDKTDLAVYEMQDDVNGAYLPPEALPVVYGDEILETRIYFKVMKPEDYAPFDAAYFIANKTDPMGNFYTDGKWYGGWSGLTFGGRDPIPGQWPCLIIPKKIAPSADKLATTSTVAKVARAVVNTVWDEKLGVAWEARMHDGCLYYVAVTNEPPEVK